MRDGIDVINCYSKGKTELGRLLTNFAHTPFILGDVSFESVEGWWYWRNVKAVEFLKLYGFAAKKLGKELMAGGLPPTREELKAVYMAKLEGNPKLKAMLLESVLPFDHYYDYDGKIQQTKWRWTGQLWNEIRDELKTM